MLTPVSATCEHGTPVWDYCPQCTYTGAPRDTIKLTVQATLTIEAEKHWSLAELAQAIEQYLNRYVDEPGYQPSTFYLRKVAVDDTTFRKLA